MTVDEVYKYIDVNPFHGKKPVFVSTKLTVEHVLEDMAKGLSVVEVLRHHPQLSERHLEAAVVYAREFPTDNQMLLIALSGFFRHW